MKFPLPEKFRAGCSSSHRLVAEKDAPPIMQTSPHS